MTPHLSLVVHVHLMVTTAMAGIVWFVQIVHYPLFTAYTRESFAAVATEHQRRTGWIVAPLMLLEAATAIWLALDAPATVGYLRRWVGLFLLLVIWASTFVVQVPLHHRLAGGFDDGALRGLTNSNWIRTIAWSLRALLALSMI
ncbi:MAG: hypothetical protein GF355_05965 [Candidatus Eisenbacteria bacterium]|nr:hypothetical protein [Candidatus Eisenbacteria bacterium]